MQQAMLVEEAADADERLPAIRRQIEQLDDRLVGLIRERTRLARAAGELKRGAGMPPVDHAREAAVVRRAATAARAAGLPEEDVRDIFWRIIAIARRAQIEAW